LAHQQQHGKLPKDTERLARMVALSHDEFLKIWGKIEDNFIPMNGGIINLKLHQLIMERKTGAKKKRISGAFATYLRKNKLNKDAYTAI
jgi:hypothetical protein